MVDLDAIRDRWRDTSPGPWEFDGAEVYSRPGYGPPVFGDFDSEEDARAIAAAPTDIEKLIGEVERLRSALSEVQAQALCDHDDAETYLGEVSLLRRAVRHFADWRCEDCGEPFDESIEAAREAWRDFAGDDADDCGCAESLRILESVNWGRDQGEMDD